MLLPESGRKFCYSCSVRKMKWYSAWPRISLTSLFDWLCGQNTRGFWSFPGSFAAEMGFLLTASVFRWFMCMNCKNVWSHFDVVLSRQVKVVTSQSNQRCVWFPNLFVISLLDGRFCTYWFRNKISNFHETIFLKDFLPFWSWRNSLHSLISWLHLFDTETVSYLLSYQPTWSLGE